MPRLSHLTPWLKGQARLPPFVDMKKDWMDQERGGFLAIDVHVPAHESMDLPAESLEASWKHCHEYVSHALELIRADEPVCLDSYERDLVRRELGDPPTLCHPIYLITIANEHEERLVYVGKTSTDHGRFRGGHRALSRLLDPKYDGFTKNIYLAAVVLLSRDSDTIPLEWVQSLSEAKGILASYESQLIYDFKPELNSQHVEHHNSTWPVQIHIQNFSGHSRFLNDYFCGPFR